MGHEIIVSALGYNSVNGTGVENYWKQQQQRGSTAQSIEVIDPQNYLNSKGQKFMNKASLIYCNIAFQCIYGAGIAEHIKSAPDRIGLYDSSELSNVEACFMFDLIAKNEGPDYVSPMNAPNTIANAAASQMAIQAGIKGPNVSVCSGAAGSLQALDLASLHLKQGLTDFAIVGSTEVNNKYQMAIRRGERRPAGLSAPELGAALLLEQKEAAEANGRKALAVIRQFASGTQLFDESREELIGRLVEQVAGRYPGSADLLIVYGGGYNIAEERQAGVLKRLNLDLPILYPEKELGAGDNAGGILGILYAIGIFRGTLSAAVSTNGTGAPGSGAIKNILVASVDSTGGAAVVLVSHPETH